MNNLNNLLKTVFLLVSLLSSSAATNNSSLALPETELAMGQNVSELVKRKDWVFLTGGALVRGITFRSGSKTQQKDCTLSFPVFEERYGNKGFLTTANCANFNVFVGSTKVGIAIRPSNFAPELGLNYVFVRIFDPYWSDYSPTIAFNEYYINNRLDFLEINVPTQPPFTGVDVCAYGGISGLACGEIVEFNVTIRSEVPSASPSEPPVVFSDVVKVRMNKGYSSGDLGAPVYIATRIPFTPQIVANPVGQVVENFDEEDKNIWYYMPIDKILEDSGLTLLVWTPNNTNNDVSINTLSSKEALMGGESSKTNIKTRDLPDPVILFGGLNAFFRKRVNPQGARMCTLGFAVKRTGPIRANFMQGFLTNAACAADIASTGRGGIPLQDVFVNRIDSRGEVEAVKVGVFRETAYSANSGLDYGVVMVDSEYWDNELSTTIIKGVKPYEVIDVLAPVNSVVGTRVCFFPEFSGEFAGGPICGEVVDNQYTAAVIDPWGRKVTRGVFTMGAGTVWYFPDMVKVKMEQTPYSQSHPQFSGIDGGTPVWVPVSRDRRLVGAQPVGILHSFEFLNDLPYMIYQKLDTIISNSEVELYRTPRQNN